jgi:hypothetical protein
VLSLIGRRSKSQRWWKRARSGEAASVGASVVTEAYGQLDAQKQWPADVVGNPKAAEDPVLKQQPVAGSEGRKLKSAGRPNPQSRQCETSAQMPVGLQEEAGASSRTGRRALLLAGLLQFLQGRRSRRTDAPRSTGQSSWPVVQGKQGLQEKAVCDDGAGRAECSLGSLATGNRPMGRFVVVQKRLGWARCVGGA